MCALEQLNALGVLSAPLQSLTITPTGNPITSHTFFQTYTAYRLGHLELATLNGSELTERETAEGEEVFGGLGQAAVSRLQQARLLALMARHR